MKKDIETFANTGNMSIFAVFNIITGKRKLANTAGIFYALMIPFITAATPVWSVNAPTTCLLVMLNDGKGQPSFYKNLPVMPKKRSIMADLVIQNSSGNDVTTSLIVAQVFGKEHNKVVRDIENLSCSTDFRVANFGEATFANPKTGQNHKMYEMTKDGFSFLVMGYTGAKAGEFKERFIAEFNKRDMMLKNDDYILMRSQQILQKRVENLQTENRRLETELEATKPAVTFTNAFKGAESSCLIGELAKIIAQNGVQIGEKRLFQWLRENGYLGKHGERYNVPNQQYIEQGLFKVKKGVRSGTGGVLHTTITTKVTGKGQVYFVNKFLNAAI